MFGVNVGTTQLLIALIAVSIFALLLVGGLVWFVLYLCKIRQEKEKYEMIAAQRKYIWLDCGFNPLDLWVTGNIKDVFGEEDLHFMGAEVYEIYDWVHEEDASVRSEIRQFLDGTDLNFKRELRIRKADGTYGWYLMTGAVRRKKNGKNKRLVICLQNVDLEMTEEKNLVQKAENDLLTGIFNKKTMEEKIDEAIAEEKANTHQILFMVDLDNFKAVNDTLGHIYGDQVLIDTAEKLKKVFHHNALIGRLGGDEFAVCAAFEAFDETHLTKYIEKKGEELRQQMQESYCCDDLTVAVSASIGIAVAPESGKEFEELYRKADKALYLSKRSGKNQFNIYQENEEDEE